MLAKSDVMREKGADAKILFETQATLVQEVFLQLEHHLAPGELEVPDLREFGSQILVQFMKLAVAAGYHPRCSWHLITGFALDLDDIYPMLDSI